METLSVREVVDAVRGELLCGDLSAQVTGVSTDTRSLQPGDIFFALKAQHDGHVFVESALEKGASGVVVSDAFSVPHGCNTAAIVVEDTLWSLGDLAAYYRTKFDVKVIAITGSVGKTSTKEMVASILSQKWNVLKNELNYNNEIGVPLTLFNLNSKHEVVVIELAMRALGEIRRLASIAKPSIGVVTNIGVSHIERLGSQGSIADAKSELLDELPADGIAILNYEDGYYDVLKERFRGRIISFGSCKGADVVGARIKCGKDGRYSFVMMLEGGAIEIDLPILGHHSVFNALAAGAVSLGMGLDLYEIRKGLLASSSPSMRMELIKTKNGITIINDAYNANPASMNAALRTLCAVKGYKRRIAILGDMLELGDYGPGAHRAIGGSLRDLGVDALIAVGESGKSVAEGARDSGFPEDAIQWYPDSKESGQGLKDLLKRGDVVLVKGSRGMRMENIVKVLESA